MLMANFVEHKQDMLPFCSLFCIRILITKFNISASHISTNAEQSTLKLPCEWYNSDS